MRRIHLPSLVLLLGMSAPLAGQVNTTKDTAANLSWGQKALTSVGPGATSLWYTVQAVSGRSYCVETGNVESALAADHFLDTIIDVFRFDGVTLVKTGDDTQEEPKNLNFSRACWVATVATGPQNFIRISPFASTAPASRQVLTLRVVETTRFCPWFFVAGDYNAFSLLRNTASSSLLVTVTWRGLSGGLAGTTDVTVPGNGTAIVNARDFVNAALVSNGSVEFSHQGSPDQIVGSTTTLSGTTGLGFDALFEPIRPW